MAGVTGVPILSLKGQSPGYSYGCVLLLLLLLLLKKQRL